MPSKDNLASSRFRTAMGLFEAGDGMMRLKLERDNPALAEEEIERPTS